MLSEDRLGVAWVRANTWKWDEEVFGKKPDGYDSMPRWGKNSKAEHLRPHMEAIESIIGEAGVSRAWWIFGMDETEEAWRSWYFAPDREHLHCRGKSVEDYVKEAGRELKKHEKN